MFFDRFNYLGTIVLIILFLDGCANNTAYKSEPILTGISYYNANKKPDTQKTIEGSNTQEKPSSTFGKGTVYAKETPSGFLLLEPDSETWKAYYYFFHLRKRIFEELPGVVPESEHDIPVILNDKVRGFIQYFQTIGRDSLSEWLSRSGKYIPKMKEILEAKGLPPDLVYLAMIESGFNVRARSNKGAVGPWQFIAPTAKRYGLRVDSWVDERMDPEKSTQAAADYLHDLYDRFSSWELAAAGYNAGEDRVKSAIEKFKDSDFWEISEYTLPGETRDYVPKLIAALIIAKNPEKYGFSDIEYQKPEPYEKVSLPPQRSLESISRITGIEYERLRDLNPSLIKASIPSGDPYEINVPAGYKEIITAKYNEIDASEKVVVQSNEIKYKVRRGDTLKKISARYNVSVSVLKSANRIRGGVRVGQVLTISSSGTNNTAYSNDKNGTSTLKKSANNKALGQYKAKKGNNNQSAALPSNANKKASQKPDTKNLIHYRVKKGDTIWDIASKYDVAVSDIKKWNNLKSVRLVAGDKLTIYLE